MPCMVLCRDSPDTNYAIRTYGMVCIPIEVEVIIIKMQFTRKSFSNLQALEDGGSMGELQGGGPLSFEEGNSYANGSQASMDSDVGKRTKRLVFVSNHLPLIMKRDTIQGWVFELDEDALIVQAREGLPDDMKAVYVGCLPNEVDPMEQDEVASMLQKQFGCYPVFLGAELKENYYKKFCKQQLWPMMHYLIPLNPLSLGRFDPALWSSYVRANMAFVNRLVEVLSSLENDFVWIHDYHLLVLPSLLRKRFHRIKCGFFLHSPFPSSEIFRTFPRREEVLRSLLNADVIGFHTFDYARHFLSCCSRMLGLEHKTSRGSIIVEYYGRDVGIKIMPTGVNPERLLAVRTWSDTEWRIGELQAEYRGKMILLGVDDMDVFKGIELKLAAFQEVLIHHPEWRGKLVLIQVTSAPRAPGKDVEDLHAYALSLVEAINTRFGEDGYQPVVWLERPVPLYEKIALYSIADVAVVTASRDGMNLMPYEYIVCRQGHEEKEDVKPSMLVVSEFVGCSPSLSGAIRVNPWSIEAVRDAIYASIRLSPSERLLRHEKHWKYVGSHTVKFWAKSYVADLQRMTQNHRKMQCFDLGFALDTFRMVALTSDFRKLNQEDVSKGYKASENRVLLLDHDGTLVPQSSISAKPDDHLLHVLTDLTSDSKNHVYIISGRARAELEEWFASVPRLGLAAEHGFYIRHPGEGEWTVQDPDAEFGWKDIVMPILELYTESTDGSHIETKESSLVWHYGNADPDFGSWQAKELLDHLEGVLFNEPVDVVQGQTIVEVKPQGVSKGRAAERSIAMTKDKSRFILCIGNDKSDEEMFSSIFAHHHENDSVFACTVGQKPSKAPYYVNDTSDVLQLLEKMVGDGQDDQPQKAPPTKEVKFYI